MTERGLAARLEAERGWHIIRWEDRWGYGVIKSAKAVAEAAPTAQELADKINRRLNKV